MQGEAVGRLIVNADVRRSSEFNDRAKIRVRKVLYSVFDAAFAAVGVGRQDRHQEDRGDGILAALSPEVPPARMVGPWVDRLYQGLRSENEDRAVPVRLRVAMHVGPVADDGRGLVGRAVDLTCRLCDSEALRLTLEAAGRYHLVLAVSDYLYESTVSNGGEAIEPEHYLPVQVVARETNAAAWVRVPGLTVPPVPAAREREEAPFRRAPADPFKDEADPAAAQGAADDYRAARSSTTRGRAHGLEDRAGRGGGRPAGGPSDLRIDTHGGESYVFNRTEIYDGHFGRLYDAAPPGRRGDNRPEGES